MTKKINILLAFMIVAAISYGQSRADSIVQNMNTLLLNQSGNTAKDIFSYSSTEKALILGQTIIPMTEDVILRQGDGTQQDKKCHAVQFYFQKGMAITLVNNKNYRRAYYELCMKDRKSADRFIDLYHQLKTHLTQ